MLPRDAGRVTSHFTSQSDDNKVSLCTEFSRTDSKIALRPGEQAISARLNLNLRILLGNARQQSGRRVLQVDVEERVHVFGSNGEPTALVQAAESKYAHQPDDGMARQ